MAQSKGKRGELWYHLLVPAAGRHVLSFYKRRVVTSPADDFLSDDIYMDSKKGFSYYTKRNIESKIYYLKKKFDREDLPMKYLIMIARIFDKIEKVLPWLNKSMYREMGIDFLFNKILLTIGLDIQLPIFISKATKRKNEEGWYIIRSLIYDDIHYIIYGGYVSFL